ncbi:MAG: FKBP-type peptidyl-prolyl cis-trans isomerase [Bacteroidia bacterium]|nr:FKBP-type peptidyl-prolyl cis-trans isomerase [Bacteroidia bacterium]MDW8302308.1 FKBP-type peptidyl-prolyl cis-trans isomerase [Bacteroidia bacterium]
MIAKNHVVGLTYTLTCPEEGNQIIDEATEDEPMYFIYGIGALLEKFESNIANLNVGDTFDFILTPEEAYGNYSAEKVIDLPKSMFMFDGMALELEIGTVLPMIDMQGNEQYGEIIDITDETVKIDFNDPLAGLTLHFKGKIIEIRPATPEELEHGHVHGPDGCED